MIIGAVMVPHPPLAVHEIGRGEEFKIHDTLNGYRAAMEFIASLKPDTVIVTSPHAVMYRDWFNVSGGKQAYGDFENFRAGNVAFDAAYDEEFTDCLTEKCEEEGFPAGTQYDRDKMLDHGTMVPLYFLNQVFSGYRLVRIGLSGLPLRMHYQLGIYLKEVSEKLGRRTVIIGSGDLSHCQKADGPYGFREQGPEYDRRIMKTMGTAEFSELFRYDSAFLNEAQECGHRSFVIMAGALDGTEVIPHVYSHEATFGVGYGIVTYEICGRNDRRHFLDAWLEEEKEAQDRKRQKEDIYVQLARKSVESWVSRNRVLKVPEGLPAEMMQKQAGTFVSIHEDGELRGCIGTISACRKNIAEEIIANAVSACSKDPRFNPVTADELPYLEISVDVLSEAEPVSDRSQLDAKKYGVICTLGFRRGLLLPNLEGVDTVDEQIEIACRKAGIDPDEEGIQLERFEVVRHV